MRPTASKLIASLLLFGGMISAAKAQERINVVTTAVPFLRISPDARAGGMGDLGIATSPDASSSFWNMGKVAFNQSQGGIAATYTPWLKQLVNDVYLASLSGYYKFAEDQAITVGLRYFSLGNIQFTDGAGNSWGNGKPREFSLDAGYSRKLSDKLGLGIALRYINSDLTNGVPTTGSTSYKAGSAVAGDIGLYYDNKTEEGDGFTFGAALSNLGSKISYTSNADQKDFIPANLGLGVTWNKAIDEQNKVMIGLDLNKLLVPGLEGNPPTQQQIDDYRSQGPVAGWGKSFSDFPGQANFSIGAEYWYNNQFALRAGYYYEDKSRGNRRYFTAGVGLKYNVFGLNFSYLAPSGSGVTQNPLSNTMRFSVLFDLDGGGSNE
ncbi:type IX secretion system outer membrane channel protein PorV [Terrimonas sp. NA20]|uniref:Type IX secretion system outer membrane channel protein PorV n=1 Tax=Terrimonas ginsenosidimutans TaxID=2908004 RepID=A0ABS9KQT1_9BACT|nr:type IX secretion system outer membrane channel protein PorV [Terrimonas ginsenosidimutans]MCG2614668.1 type IX secretion system outer membrane channel protein PorV [Terrimonas ginsenosidimutans]